MLSDFQKAVDHYIQDGRYRDLGDVKHKCPKCFIEWKAAMHEEYGGAFYRKDDDASCPNGCKDLDGQSLCGELYETDEEIKEYGRNKNNGCNY